MRVKNISKLFFGAFFATILTFFSSSSVIAAEETPEYRLQITPARQDIGNLAPGETYSGNFKVQNTGKNKFDFEVDVVPYSVTDQDYSANFENGNQYTYITEWTKLSQDSGTVEPGGEVEISYTINVPLDVPAGGQYAAIAVSMKEDGEGSGGSAIGLTQRLASIIYSNVSGNTRKTGSISENKISGILFNPPITATSVVENTGNTHAEARYILQVFPLFGNDEVYSNEDDPATAMILPETSRFNTVAWQNAPHLGIFRVKQTVSIFDQIDVTEKIVFLCPIWLLFIVLLLIFCAIFWIFSRVKGRKDS